MVLWIDQIEDYQNELVKLEDELHFEDREEERKMLLERRQEIINILNMDKEDRKFYFNI